MILFPLRQNRRIAKVFYLIIFFSIGVSALKVYAFMLTNSNTILIDTAESFVNIFSSSLAFYSFFLSHKSKDSDHPYGHGKVEFFVPFCVGIFMIITALIMIGKTLYSFYNPYTISNIEAGGGLVFLTCIINLLLAYILLKVYKKYNSVALKAESIHLFSDALTSLYALVGILLLKFFVLSYIDAIFALSLGVWLSINGLKLIKQSYNGLMDATDFDKVDEMVSILNKNKRPDWVNIHNLRLIQYGNAIHLDCHLTVPFFYSLKTTHKLVHEIEQILDQNTTSTVETFIHTDPCNPSCCHYCTKMDCTHRVHPFIKEQIWDSENLRANQKEQF